MDRITINGLKFHAFHGHLPVERKTGNTFVVDLILYTNLSKSGKSDKLIDTVDYVHIMTLISEIMDSPSDLIENVAHRIIDKIKSTFKEVEKIEVTVKKEKPPLHFDVKGVEVTLVR